MTFINNELPLIINEFSDREIAWIFEVRSDKSIRADSLDQKRSIIREHMHSSVENHKGITDLRLRSESCLLPEEELTWIKKTDIRLLRWLLHYCSRPHIGSGPATQIPINPLFNAPESAYYDHFVSALDIWPVDIHFKSQSLNNIKSIWTELLLKDRKLNWLRKDNDSQIDWAWSYLNTYLDKQGRFGSHKYSPMTPSETYLAILSTFDTWHGDTGYLYLLQTNMKQAWAQQKYRSTLTAKKKKQSTYVLGEKTKENLEEIAIARNVNLNEMLEHIINEAYKNYKKDKN